MEQNRKNLARNINKRVIGVHDRNIRGLDSTFFRDIFNDIDRNLFNDAITKTENRPKFLFVYRNFGNIENIVEITKLIDNLIFEINSVTIPDNDIQFAIDVCYAIVTEAIRIIKGIERNRDLLECIYEKISNNTNFNFDKIIVADESQNIQGFELENNSCYMDSLLIMMFGTSNNYWIDQIIQNIDTMEYDSEIFRIICPNAEYKYAYEIKEYKKNLGNELWTNIKRIRGLERIQSCGFLRDLLQNCMGTLQDNKGNWKKSDILEVYTRLAAIFTTLQFPVMIWDDNSDQLQMSQQSIIPIKWFLLETEYFDITKITNPIITFGFGVDYNFEKIKQTNKNFQVDLSNYNDQIRQLFDIEEASREFKERLILGDSEYSILACGINVGGNHYICVFKRNGEWYEYNNMANPLFVKKSFNEIKNRIFIYGYGQNNKIYKPSLWFYEKIGEIDPVISTFNNIKMCQIDILLLILFSHSRYWYDKLINFEMPDNDYLDFTVKCDGRKTRSQKIDFIERLVKSLIGNYDRLKGNRTVCDNLLSILDECKVIDRPNFKNPETPWEYLESIDYKIIVDSGEKGYSEFSEWTNKNRYYSGLYNDLVKFLNLPQTYTRSWITINKIRELKNKMDPVLVIVNDSNNSNFNEMKKFTRDSMVYNEEHLEKLNFEHKGYDFLGFITRKSSGNKEIWFQSYFNKNGKMYKFDQQKSIIEIAEKDWETFAFSRTDTNTPVMWFYEMRK